MQSARALEVLEAPDQLASSDGEDGDRSKAIIEDSLAESEDTSKDNIKKSPSRDDSVTSKPVHKKKTKKAPKTGHEKRSVGKRQWPGARIQMYENLGLQKRIPEYAREGVGEFHQAESVATPANVDPVYLNGIVVSQEEQDTVSI